MELLQLKDMVGGAIRKYHDKNLPLEEAMRDAEKAMGELRREFPENYKDKAEVYVDAAFRADTGAHTQHPAAKYVDMRTGRVEVDYQCRYADYQCKWPACNIRQIIFYSPGRQRKASLSSPQRP